MEMWMFLYILAIPCIGKYHKKLNKGKIAYSNLLYSV